MNNYPYSDMLAKQVECGATTLGRPMNLQENLQYELAQAESKTIRLKELLDLLEKHPEVNRIMELLGQR